MEHKQMLCLAAEEVLEEGGQPTYHLGHHDCLWVPSDLLV